MSKLENTVGGQFSMEDDQFKMTHLPPLEVSREEYCDQATTDSAISYLESSLPDLLKKLFQVSKTCPETDFSEVLNKICQALKEAHSRSELYFPDTYLGRLDFLFEVSRRFEKLHGFKGRQPARLSGEMWQGYCLYENIQFVLSGRPFSLSTIGPYPERLIFSPDWNDPDLGGQAAIEIVNEIYKERPELFYFLSEEIRRNQELFETLHLMLSLIEVKLKARLSISDVKLKSLSVQLFIQIRKSLYKECNL